ncbi:hypothetical protein D9756_003888 [Leucocoprinus leucothites]|uniref:Uncharacterized protein n=1 Tax=Leucocoprinus leucothites TaxID=201217 RepID=A0A8H5LDQ8_9AGAR|nr:hypothetical protein D9756_003888 [Leucoagaricus leucothites]
MTSHASASTSNCVPFTDVAQLQGRAQKEQQRKTLMVTPVKKHNQPFKTRYPFAFIAPPVTTHNLKPFIRALSQEEYNVV